MTEEQPPQSGKREQEERRPRDAAFWARRVEKLEVSEVPSGAINLNVHGRHEVGALQGFGPLWQKTYRVRPVEQEKVWIHVLTSLATRLEVSEQVKFQKVCVDPKLQWSQVGNVWPNAKARSVLHAVATTWRWVYGLTRLRNLNCLARNAGLHEVSNAT